MEIRTPKKRHPLKDIKCMDFVWGLGAGVWGLGAGVWDRTVGRAAGAPKP